MRNLFDAGDDALVPNFGMLALTPGAEGLCLLEKPAMPESLPGFLGTILGGVLPNEALWDIVESAISFLLTAGSLE